MLNLIDSGTRHCDGISRRTLMKIGALGLSGLSLPGLLRHESLAADATSVWVLWMQEQAGQQTLWLARYPHALGEPEWRQQIAAVAGRGRGTGFPRLVLRDGRAHVVWTDVAAGRPRLRGLQFTP